MIDEKWLLRVIRFIPWKKEKAKVDRFMMVPTENSCCHHLLMVGELVSSV